MLNQNEQSQILLQLQILMPFRWTLRQMQTATSARLQDIITQNTKCQQNVRAMVKSHPSS